MATTVAQHSVATFTSPVNGTTPIDANTVRGNDNTIRSSYNDHDADPGIHVQSSTLASRPVAGTAGRKWITEDSGVYTLWFDDGTNWHPVSSENVALTVLAGETLAKGDVVKVTGWNNGQDLPEVVKTTSAADTAFAVITAAVSSGSMGYATNTGIVQDVNTAAYSVGTILYANGSGGFTSTKPTSGNYQPVAYVLRANASNGVYYVEFSTPRIVERSDNTASTVVLRDASGNFSAGTITATAVNATTLDLTNLEVTNIKAKDGTQAIAIADTTGKLTISDGVLLSGLTASQAVFTDGSKNLVSNAITGTGNVVMSASPTLTGTVTAATLNATTLGGTLSTAAQPNVTSVGTLSSLTVSGNVTVDTNTLFVDATNNRVGIGTASPAAVAHIAGTTNQRIARFNGAGTNFHLDVRSYDGSVADAAAYRLNLDYLDGTAANSFIDFYRGSGGANGYLGFGTSGTTRALLDASGNLGLGTSPATVFTGASSTTPLAQFAKTDNTTTLNLTTSSLALINTSTTAGASSALNFVSVNSGSSRVAHAAIYGGTGAVNAGWNDGFLAFATGTAGAAPAERARIDASGNLGLGVTPTIASLPTFESEYALLTGRSECNVVSNAVFNSGFKYINAAAATRYQGNAGSHIWSRAASGSVGGAVTWLESALINASGFFKASNSGTYLGASGTYHEIRSDDAGEPSVAIQSTNASYTGTVTLIRASKAAGTTFNLLNAQSNLVDQFTVRGDGTVYAQNTTIQAISDARLKENIVNSTEGLDVIAALRPVRYDWKAGHGNDRKHQLGFIAQEIEAVFPDAVSEWFMGSETYKTVGPAALIPVLVKAIQELDTRLKALEA